jgi:hypothetical protein
MNFKCFLIATIGLFSFYNASIAQKDSKLSTGKWVKIGLTQNGIYKIDAVWLDKNKIDRSTINPKQVSLYSTNSGILPQDLTTTRPQDLEEVPIYFEGDQDSQWDVNDFFIFWGNSPHQIVFDFQKKVWGQEVHAYSDSSFYFIRLDDPAAKRIKEEKAMPGESKSMDYAWSIFHYEPETYNLLQSGRQWLGDAFYGTNSKTVQYPLADYKPGINSKLKGRFYSSSIQEGVFSFDVAGSPIENLKIPAISGGRYDNKANYKDLDLWLAPQIKDNLWSWTIQYKNTTGTGYLDYLSLQYPRIFNAKHDNPLYLLPNTIDSSFSISILNSSASTQIWIRNGRNEWSKMINHSSNLKLNVKPESQLLLFDSQKSLTPTYIKRLTNQNINKDVGYELLIISSPALKEAANALANYKINAQSISTKVVDTEQIYHEYSGGKQDITAIRDFIYQQYKHPNSSLKYVILFGDASIDYKGKSIVSSDIEKNCFVPTYQSIESFQPLLSYSSDDYFGLLNPEEGDWLEGDQTNKKTLQVAIGRIPAKNPSEANFFVNKLIAFIESKKNNRFKPEVFAWVADDGDANIHMQDAEDFSDLMIKEANDVHIKKVYLDQFEQEMTNGTYTSKKAKDAVISLFNSEADFIHFVGHGSESGWTDEKILTNNDLVGLTNLKHLPLLLTATCQFGRFDDPNQLSGAEISLMSTKGGAIGLISTTRPVFQSSNYLFGQLFYKNLIDHKTQVKYRLGDLFKETKNNSQTGVINRNISFLGDPTLELPWTGQSIRIKTDSIIPGSEKFLEGQLLTNTILGSNAGIKVNLYAPPSKKKTLGTKTNAYEYFVEGDLVWTSNNQMTGNGFSISQKSIPNTQGPLICKIIGQTRSGEKINGFKSLPTRISNATIADTKPPSITVLEPESNKFHTMNSNFELKLRIEDENALRWKNDLNEPAELIINDTLKIKVSDYFIPDVGFPHKGTFIYPFKNLKTGTYLFKVYCWDGNYNQQKQIFELKVINSDANRLEWVIYPNPMRNRLHFRAIGQIPWDIYRYDLRIFTILGQEILLKKGVITYFSNTDLTLEIDWSEEELTKLIGNSVFKLALFPGKNEENILLTGKITTLK